MDEAIKKLLLDSGNYHLHTDCAAGMFDISDETLEQDERLVEMVNMRKSLISMAESLTKEIEDKKREIIYERGKEHSRNIIIDIYRINDEYVMLSLLLNTSHAGFNMKFPPGWVISFCIAHSDISSPKYSKGVVYHWYTGIGNSGLSDSTSMIKESAKVFPYEGYKDAIYAAQEQYFYMKYLFRSEEYLQLMADFIDKEYSRKKMEYENNNNKEEEENDV